MPKCNILFNHLYVGINGRYQTCCRANISDTEITNITTPYKEYLGLPYRNEILSSMENGWHSNCARCKQEEDSGFRSMRQNTNETLTGVKNKLEFIEINASNVCNLSCKMCNNVISSKWQSIFEKNNNILSVYGFTDNPVENKFSIRNMLDNTDLTFVNKIRLCAGEPFLNGDIETIIDVLNQHSIMGNITLEVTTNCTFFPKKMLEFLSKFKKVSLFLSLDGIGPMCNYIRTGMEWNNVQNVIMLWKEFSNSFKNVDLYFKHTMQAYNAHHFNEIKKFSSEIGIKLIPSMLTTPVFLTHSVLPVDYVNEIISNGMLTDERLISKIYSLGFSKENFDKFRDYTRDLDAIQGTDISVVNPILSKYLN